MTTGSTGTINTGALLRAGGIGLAVAFLFSICNNGFSYVSTQMTSTNDPSQAGVGAALAFVALCGCCLLYLGFGGIGALYGWFAQKDTPILEMGPTALGGALTAVAVGFLAGLCNGVIGLITGVSQFSQAGSLGGSQTTALAASGIVGLLIGLCFAIFLSAGFGAAGGAIYASVRGNKPSAASPAM